LRKLGIFILTLLLIIDSLNNILRIYTSKADLNKVYTPHSLQHTRGMFQMLTKIGPICTASGKVFLGAFVTSEVIIPQVLGSPINIGIGTKFVANNIIYKNLEFPISNRYAMAFESIRHQVNTEIDMSFRSENDQINPRTRSLVRDKDFQDLNLGPEVIELIKSSAGSISMTQKKK
jgi:hypothetical protein